MKAAALPLMQVDVGEKSRLTRHLNLKDRGAYERLLDHYWEWGRLLPGDHNLAVICGVHIRTFLSMRDRLALLFEPDETGLWRDYDLEEQRDAALRTRAVRAQSGRMGASATHGAGRRSAPAEAEPLANAMANAKAEDAEFAAEAAETADFAQANALAPLAAAVLSQGERDECSILQDLPPLSPLAAGADARDGVAGAVAFALAPAVATPPPEAPAAGTSAMANALAPAAAIPPPAAASTGTAAVANGMAHAMAEKPTSAPRSDPDIDLPAGKAAAVAPSPAAVPSHQPPAEAIFAKLRQACGDKLQDGLLTPGEIAPIRALIDEGFDLDLEIVPGIADKVLRLSGKLETFRAPFLRSAILNRAKRRTAKAGTASAALAQGGLAPAADGVFVGKDWPQWAPWCDHLKRAGTPPKTAIQFKQGLGNYFPSLWPPGYSTASPAAAAAE